MSKMMTGETTKASEPMMTRAQRSFLSRGLLCCLLLLLLSPMAALAQTGVKDKDGFEPESRPAMMGSVKDETVPAQPLVAAAYGFIWLAVLVFVGSVAMRTTRLEAEIAHLQEKLEKGASR